MTDIKVLAVWCERLLWPERRGLSHLPLLVPCLQQKGESLCGCFAGAQGTCCPQERVLEQAGGRGGRKDAQGLLCWGATLLHHRSKDRSLSAQHRGCMYVPKDTLLAMGSCPPLLPALQGSSFPLDNSVACTHFSFFFLSFSHAEIQPIHQICPKAASLLLMERPHAARHPPGCLPPAQSTTCLVQPPTMGGSPCPFPLQQSPLQEGFFGLMTVFASFSVAGREAVTRSVESRGK